MEIGIVGKPNVGKSTLFASLTQINVPIANYPFTTKSVHRGITYVRIKCVCKEFGVKDNPSNSLCIKGNRFIPIEVMDTAGLVPDAWRGRGLGNKFLDHISKADLIIHVVDVSGSTDINGNLVKPGYHDPIRDIKFLENELLMWFLSKVRKHWDSIIKDVELKRIAFPKSLSYRLSGLKIKEKEIIETLNSCEHLKNKKISNWGDDDIRLFTATILKKTKPMIIAANKIDYEVSEENITRIREYGYEVIPISAISELVLRKLSNKGIINYLPGDNYFDIINKNKLTKEQLKSLYTIKKLIFDKYGSTGVQKLINHCVFEVLNYIVVYPVRDPIKLCDKNGNILPDAYLIKRDTALKDFVSMIHTEIADKFLYGIDVKRKTRLKGDYILKNNDVVSFVTV